MRHRSRVVHGTGWLIVAVAMLLASCSATSFPPKIASPRNAAAALRDAAAESGTGRAVLTGSLDGDTGPVLRVTGYVDYPGGTVSLTTSSALSTNRYPPFESRFVAGRQYVQIDSAVKRPPHLGPGINWIEFERPPRDLPIPDQTIPSSYPLEIVDLLHKGETTDARFVAPSASGQVRVEFQVPSFATPSETELFTATIGSDGRLAEITTSYRLDINPTGNFQQDGDLRFTWPASVPTTAAPPAEQVHRLASGENLYPPGAGPTTTLPPVSPSDAAAGNRALFDSNRADIERSLRATPDPRLVSFVYDDTANEIRVQFASANPTTETRAQYDAVAWQTAKSLSGSFWFPELVQNVIAQHGDATWLPKLRITIDKAEYECASHTQIALAGAGLTQQTWVAQCTP